MEDPKKDLRAEMARERARLMDEAAQKLEAARLLEAKMEKLAEFEKTAAEFGFELVRRDGNPDQKADAPPPSGPEKPEPTVNFDGTLAGLIDCYETDPRSPIWTLKRSVSRNYKSAFRSIKETVGAERVADWNAGHVMEVYSNKWSVKGVSMGHTLVAKLRLLCTYGATTLNDDACIRLSAILGNLRIPKSKARTVALTADHANAIRAEAHRRGLHSIALAQAFQLEVPQLRQMDVIGEWVPISDKTPSEITKDDEKWIRGLRWSDIDEHGVLRRTLTAGRQNQHKLIEVDLSRCPMVMQELAAVPTVNRIGPMVVNEMTKLPWTAVGFRQRWRHIAVAVGVPTHVRNSDSVRASKDEGGMKTGVFA